MSPERSQAYSRVIHTLRELGPSKLLGCEQDRIRLAADSLVFSTDLEDDLEAQLAFEDAAQLCRDLVQSGRWEPVTAARLSRNLRDCGPEPVILLAA